MTTQSQNEPKALLRRFADAINAHDLDAIVSCFAPDYHDIEPAHPKRQIVGGEEVVRKNWGTVLRSVTDFRTEVRTIAAEGEVGLIEHDSPFRKHRLRHAVSAQYSPITAVRTLARGHASRGLIHGHWLSSSLAA